MTPSLARILTTNPAQHNLKGPQNSCLSSLDLSPSSQTGASPGPSHHSSRHSTRLLQEVPVSQPAGPAGPTQDHSTSLPGSPPGPSLHPTTQVSQTSSIANPITLRYLPGRGPMVQTVVPAHRTGRTGRGKEGGRKGWEGGKKDMCPPPKAPRSVQGCPHAPPLATSSLGVRALQISTDLLELPIRPLLPLLRAFLWIFPPSPATPRTASHTQPGTTPPFKHPLH